MLRDPCEGVEFLTVFAFSTENWKREQQEVDVPRSHLSKGLIRP